MNPRRYRYPASLDGRSIRLLQISSTKAQAIHAGRTDHEVSQHQGVLCLDLVRFDIGSEPPYRALSYTWGAPEENESDNVEAEETFVLINGECHDVTTNLLDAILQLRESYPDDSYVWIDALCINQGDLEERRVQVAIMDSIFQNADEVVVWLGQANAHTADIFALVDKVGALDRPFFRLFGHAESPNQLSSYGLPDKADEIWRHYMELYERRWFHRGWVIQEVVMAKRAIVHWGAFQMPWAKLVAGSKIFLPERLRKFFFSQFRGHVEHIHSLALGRNAYRIGLIQEACLQSNFEQLLIVKICTGKGGFASAEHILLHLMRMARDFSWTDPRDRVYSLLGLVNFTARLHNVPPLDLMPDYRESKTAAAVLTEAATAIINRSKCLGIIAQVSDMSFRKIKDLPSWVPDFVRSPNFSQGRRTIFKAYGNRVTDKPLYEIQGRTLHVQGRRIGSVDETLNLDHGGRLSDILKLVAMAYKARLPSEQDRAEVLWRTMVWDVYGHSAAGDEHPAPSFLGDSFIGWIRSIASSQMNLQTERDSSGSTVSVGSVPLPAEGPDLASTTAKLKAALGLSSGTSIGHHKMDAPAGRAEADGEEFKSHSGTVTWSQRLLLLDTGYLAMGPKSSEVRDEIWVIPGCIFPMVLRSGSDGSHIVMGRAYVHGAMHGEAVASDEPWERLCLS